MDQCLVTSVTRSEKSDEWAHLEYYPSYTLTIQIEDAIPIVVYGMQ
jgi:hypothetical protein